MSWKKAILPGALPGQLNPLYECALNRRLGSGLPRSHVAGWPDSAAIAFHVQPSATFRFPDVLGGQPAG